jgi:hypothetical protein
MVAGRIFVSSGYNVLSLGAVYNLLYSQKSDKILILHTLYEAYFMVSSGIFGLR